MDTLLTTTYDSFLIVSISTLLNMLITWLILLILELFFTFINDGIGKTFKLVALQTSELKVHRYMNKSKGASSMMIFHFWADFDDFFILG